MLINVNIIRKGNYFEEQTHTHHELERKKNARIEITKKKVNMNINQVLYLVEDLRLVCHECNFMMNDLIRMNKTVKLCSL